MGEKKIVKQPDKVKKASAALENARRVKAWIESQEEPRKPLNNSKNEEERKLANNFLQSRYRLLKPYFELKTEEEREKYRQKYPEIEEVIKIVKEIEIMTSTPLQNVRRIEEWIESQEKPRKPSQTSKNEKERKLGRTFVNIKHFLIKPYLELKTEEEREKYRQKYPELDEVMQLVAEIEEKYGNINQKRLAELLKTDLQKRKQVEEAKKLEAMYEQLENTRDSTISYEGEIMNE